jgi:hypothetical protein
MWGCLGVHTVGIMISPYVELNSFFEFSKNLDKKKLNFI